MKASELFGKHPVHVLLILNFTTIALYGYVTSAKVRCHSCRHKRRSRQDVTVLDDVAYVDACTWMAPRC